VRRTPLNREETMPKTKNQGKNKSRFEVRGGLLNEYEFALNEGAMTEEERNRLAQMDEERALREGAEGAGDAAPLSPQEREAARIREVIETAHEKAQRNIEKRERRAAGGAKKGAGKGAAGKASKTGAGKKAAGKKGGKEGAAKRGGAGKGAQKRGATKKAAKSAGKKSAKKSGVAVGRGAKGSARKDGAKKASTKKGGRSSARSR
jgi:hypothetical protein